MKKLLFIVTALSLFVACSHSESGLGDPLVSGIFSRNIKTVTHELSEDTYKKKSSKYTSYKNFLDVRLNQKRDLHGKTPLFWGCMANYSSSKQLKKVEKKRLEIVKLLVEKGADITLKDNEGWTPLVWASWSGTDKIVSFLLNKGAKINVQTDKKWTSLMAASLRGYDVVVKLLLDRSADKTVKNSDGETALDIARTYQKMYPNKKVAYDKIISYLQ